MTEIRWNQHLVADILWYFLLVVSRTLMLNVLMMCSKNLTAAVSKPNR
jgi:hypothetical protein